MVTTFTFFYFQFFDFLSKAGVTCLRRVAATRIKGACLGSEAELVPEPGALPPYICVRRVIQLQHYSEAKAESVRFVSRREAPSEVGKTRTWLKTSV